MRRLYLLPLSQILYAWIDYVDSHHPALSVTELCTAVDNITVMAQSFEPTLMITMGINQSSHVDASFVNQMRGARAGALPHVRAENDELAIYDDGDDIAIFLKAHLLTKDMVRMTIARHDGIERGCWHQSLTFDAIVWTIADIRRYFILCCLLFSGRRISRFRVGPT